MRCRYPSSPFFALGRGHEVSVHVNGHIHLRDPAGPPPANSHESDLKLLASDAAKDLQRVHSRSQKVTGTPGSNKRAGGPSKPAVGASKSAKGPSKPATGGSSKPAKGPAKQATGGPSKPAVGASKPAKGSSKQA